ncbi:NAD(P)/FAD-dependent oxidoreductase [Saccharopolyspora gloriosae]|uniref:phytoene desaturase family protein n=1 Tax=Saccharopolyspora gloriosae TaxID=455344 RepID=UPI001FB79296|nr:NAD(P)-binding protein [Saccharopolyspora gloriosae]
MSREAATSRPSVIIVGGGLAGLAAGCYAQMSGMRSTVLERHVLPGGCCTAWGRDGYIFDYCIEWLLGTAAGNEANQVWRELGALDGKEITNFEMFNRVVGADGRSVTFYNDPDRLERHLLEVSPADAPVLRSFCQDLRLFLEADLLSFLTPPSLRTAREEREAEIKAAPVRSVLERTSATRLEDFTARLRDPLLRRAFPNIFFQDHESFPLLPYLLNMAAANHGNAGVPQGGSLGPGR